TLPPTWIIVILGDFIEAELLVVIRADPFSGVERAFLERRRDIAGCELLRDGAEFRENCARETADAKFESLEVVDRIDRVPAPSAPLGPGAWPRQSADI